MVELSLGIPCAPFILTKFVVTDGELETVVTGRKFTLREKLLAKQEKYMRLSADSEIEAMSDGCHFFLKNVQKKKRNSNKCNGHAH